MKLSGAITHHICKVAIAATLLSAMHAGKGRATTFVAMSDEDLAEASAAIVLGTVSHIDTADATNGIQTSVSVDVTESVKGAVAPVTSFLIPGGMANGSRRVVFGAPTFFLGERVIVFLRQRNDGVLAPVGMAMGKFTVITRNGDEVARRQLDSEGSAVFTYDKRSRQLVSAASQDERPLAEFLAALRAASPGPGSFKRSERVRSSVAKESDFFTYLSTPSARWSAPDRGQALRYHVVHSGDWRLGPEASLDAVHAAMKAWSNGGSKLRMVDAGDIAPSPYSACDGESTIQFNDLFNDIGAPINCSGVLAMGGFCIDANTTSMVDGQQFAEISEGDLTVNAGFTGCGFWDATNVAEVLTHELGHSIGLGHSSELAREPSPVLESATMFYMAHFDGRGAALRDDDRAALRSLYGTVPRVRPRPLRRSARDQSRRRS